MSKEDKSNGLEKSQITFIRSVNDDLKDGFLIQIKFHSEENRQFILDRCQEKPRETQYDLSLFDGLS